MWKTILVYNDATGFQFFKPYRLLHVLLVKLVLEIFKEESMHKQEEILLQVFTNHISGVVRFYCLLENKSTSKT